MYEVWPCSECPGRLVFDVTFFVCSRDVTLLHLFSIKIVYFQQLCDLKWSETNMDNKGPTLWSEIASGKVLVQCAKFDLSFPVTWQRQVRFPGAASHLKNLSWPDGNDKKCLQSQTMVLHSCWFHEVSMHSYSFFLLRHIASTKHYHVYFCRGVSNIYLE